MMQVCCRQLAKGSRHRYHDHVSLNFATLARCRSRNWYMLWLHMYSLNYSDGPYSSAWVKHSNLIVTPELLGWVILELASFHVVSMETCATTGDSIGQTIHGIGSVSPRTCNTTCTTVSLHRNIHETNYTSVIFAGFTLYIRSGPRN